MSELSTTITLCFVFDAVPRNAQHFCNHSFSKVMEVIVRLKKGKFRITSRDFPVSSPLDNCYYR